MFSCLLAHSQIIVICCLNIQISHIAYDHKAFRELGLFGLHKLEVVKEKEWEM